MVNVRPINSMTGSATADGNSEGLAYTWDIRSVNSKGCDIRFRTPDWIEGLEPAAKKSASAAISRGSVTVSLRLGSRDSGENVTIDPAKLDSVTRDLATIASHCATVGLQTRAPSLAEIYALPQISQSTKSVDVPPFRTQALKDFAICLAAFLDSRKEEGAALLSILSAQLDEIDGLLTAARAALPPRTERQKAQLKSGLTRLMDDTEIDEARLAQELAIIAMKSDVAEELDRLDAHVAAARKLLGQGGVIGRRFDFLTQEFNREANTLCSKAGDAALTEIGLDLKTIIDRMREQVQNVE